MSTATIWDQNLFLALHSLLSQPQESYRSFLRFRHGSVSTTIHDVAWAPLDGNAMCPCHAGQSPTGTHRPLINNCVDQ